MSYGLKSFAHEGGIRKQTSLSLDSMPSEWRTYTAIVSCHRFPCVRSLRQAKNLKDSPEGEGFRPIVVTINRRFTQLNSLNAGLHRIPTYIDGD